MGLKYLSLAPIVFLAVFFFSATVARAADDTLFPLEHCKNTAPLTDQEALAVVQKAAPHLVKTVAGRLFPTVPMREIDNPQARIIMLGAEQKKWGIIDFLNDPEFQRDCVYYLGVEALRVVHDEFNMDLATPLAGKDHNGNAFRMRAMIVGMKKLDLLYDRDRVTYYNPRAERTMSLRRTVHFTMARYEDQGKTVKMLVEVKNLSVHTGFPYGWETITAVRARKGQIEFYVLDKWRGGTPVIPIARRSQTNQDIMCAETEKVAVAHLGTSHVGGDVTVNSLESLRRLSELKSNGVTSSIFQFSGDGRRGSAEY